MEYREEDTWVHTHMWNGRVFTFNASQRENRYQSELQKIKSSYVQCSRGWYTLAYHQDTLVAYLT